MPRHTSQSLTSFMQNSEPAKRHAPDIGASLKKICPNAIEIVLRLREKGFEAYIVGGCIRDLLIGITPKDFDVATDAEPEEIVYLFERARIIGRRFQIVHVREGRETVEVTTFRAHHEGEFAEDQAERNDSGMLLRDNVYGDLSDDAMRRDFSINALYFCPETEQIIDYTDGLVDIDKKVLRVIGTPEIRFREDPVRMLRAARFNAKLGFELDGETTECIAECGELLSQIAPARLFDETLKLFLGGYAAKAFASLQKFDLFKYLFPATDKCLKAKQEYAQPLIEATMGNTDQRIELGKPVTPAFLYAALLWPAVVSRKQELLANGLQDFDALREAGRDASFAQMNHTSVPKRFAIPMREIWELHARLRRHDGKRAARLRDNPRFRAAYDFVLLREQSGEDLEGLGAWWTEYQEQNPVDPNATRQRRPRSRSRRRNNDQQQGRAGGNRSNNKSGGNKASGSKPGASKPKRKRKPARGQTHPNQNGNVSSFREIDGNVASDDGSSFEPNFNR